MDYSQFCEDEWQIDAVLHNFTLIGEASRHVPAEMKARFPNVAWEDMSDMRNLVVHEYFGVDLIIVWQTIQEDLPRLIEQLEEIIEKMDSSA